MIRILAVDQQNNVLINPAVEDLKTSLTKWFWVDISMPTVTESEMLTDFFDFHPLAVEDCLYYTQRPKLEYYEDHSFFVVHALNLQNLEPHEVDIFWGENYVVSFHLDDISEIDQLWETLQKVKNYTKVGPIEITHKIMDKIVDTYFPILQQIEDQILSIESNFNLSDEAVIQETFLVRSELIKLRKTIIPMRELLYRVTESKKLPITSKKMAYFHDVHDHLIKLSHMVESSREMTSEIRDNYISLNSFRMNRIMKTLTVITTIFMPLTFIAGIYGMNFDNMPELHWHYGYFIVLGAMLTIGISMILWFIRKGWFKDK
ncbi:magnesium/cobalt transporter CorA [Fictibacillus barbaricus]|uniref:Magnesium transport protein CorA n=1 Tax=Fictibacillus barbaricus TaxID=182136 RepID=A0ABS2ZCR2_9BACL|nr:magnesium/cobalt transporter CorA [Fictibacillus barbaricus]MBN3545226.1 magnesium/cobalt transporter CorA [Fictibacillus barbaricus]GGB60663.1 putative metal ion transporter YfjQ [Fictibacillus barbaricus]